MSKMNSFIDYASDILGDTDNGISTAQIISICNKFASEYNVNIPHTRIYTGYSQTFNNKRTALKENLQRFNEQQAFDIIKYICELNNYNELKEFKDVKVRLYLNFPQYVNKKENIDIDNEIIKSTELLSSYPKAKKTYEDACSLYEFGMYQRNLIDNLRLTLEYNNNNIKHNEKSLEHNIDEICTFFKNKNCSQQFINMFRKLIDYYLKYNNDNIKHDENININEISFIFGLTNLFIKLLIS